MSFKQLLPLLVAVFVISLDKSSFTHGDVFEAVPTAGTNETVSGLPPESLPCPEGLVYQRCPPPCPRKCSHTTGESLCADSACDGGCFCPKGQVLIKNNHGKHTCIRPGKCAARKRQVERQLEKLRKAAQMKAKRKEKKAAARKANKMKKPTTLTVCQQQRLSEKKACKEKTGAGAQCARTVVKCNRHGEYFPRHCVNSTCHCVSESGGIMPGSEHARTNKSVDCPGIRAGVTCSGGKRYHRCRPKCPHACPQLNHTCVDPTDEEACEPGCYCARGFLVESGGSCVRARSCGRAALRRARKLRLEKARKAKEAAKTPCQRQRAAHLKNCQQENTNSSQSDLKACRQSATMCNRQGGFAAKQCQSNHQCVCVDEEGGRLEGTRHAVRGENRKHVDCLAARAGVVCPRGQRYSACQPKTCPRTCSHVRGENCSAIDRDVTCVPGCYCTRGHVLDNGTCVRASQKHCKLKTPCQRQRAAHLNKCQRANTKSSQSDLKACRQSATMCDRQGGFAAKQCSSNYQCVCVDEEGGHLEGTRHAVRGKNRKHVDCLAARAGVVCPRGQRYSACQPKTCPRTCFHVRGENCSTIDRGVTCVPGCYCTKGHVLDDGTCVRASQKHCKLKTPCQRQRVAHLKNCQQANTNSSQSDLKACRQSATMCDRQGGFAAKQCSSNHQCVCVDEEGGHLEGTRHAIRGKNRKHVDCLAARAGVVCPRGQRYSACQPKTCPRTCSHVRGENCSTVDRDVTCVPGCYCTRGHVLDIDICVRASQKHCKLLTPCERRRRAELRACALSHDKLAACNAIVCNKDGSFAAKQCYRVAEMCHCVDAQGHFMQGSTHPFPLRREVNCEELRST